MASATIPINVNQNPQGIGIVPTRANVPNRIPSGPDSITLVWNATGSASFASDEYFQWKGNPPGAPAVNFVNSTELRSDSYVNDFPEPGVVWAYKIKVSGVWVDPEVNNEPPGHVNP